MKDYDQFHDGSLEGLWIDGSNVHVHVGTWDEKRFTAVAGDVAALSANGFRAGNIILNMRTRSCEEITFEDIAELYDLREGPAGESQGADLLAEAQQEGLMVLQINPSYGATCVVLAHSVELLQRVDWAQRYCARGTT